MTTAVANRVGQFADMSVALTGFTADTINNPLNPNNLNQSYLDLADAKVGQPLVDQLLAQFAALQGKTSQEIADALLGISPAASGPTVQLARSLLMLWYLGSWYGAKTQSAFDGSTVSSTAYIGGLAWRAIQAHPMGYSEFSFGYWSENPPSLADFGADVPGAQS